jgi:UDP-N-acetylglucosamine 4,6-dehydratase
VKFVLGDIRDYDSLKPHFWGKSLVFHLAAMKHVDMAEANPEESIKINVLGTVNVAKAAMEASVPYCVFSSTDKAVLPINVYGMCKGISERYLLSLNEAQSITRFSVFRWGNVLGSRGSVIHAFAKTLREANTVYITDFRMTRFWVEIGSVARFMLERFDTDEARTEVQIPPMRGAKVTRIADLTARHLGFANYKIKAAGIRPGEKLHECILSSHDHCVRSDNVGEYSDEELLEMIQRTEL